MATEAPYGSWKSPLTPDIFTQGNCKTFVELQQHKESLFWIEQNIETGKREVYEAKNGSADARIRWAPEKSVQNAVHEYGGGSFIVLPKSGALLFSTVDGVWLQANPDETPQQILESPSKKLRYADFGAAPDDSYFLAVQEVHSTAEEGLPHALPENRIVGYDFATKQTSVVASGCDFYAQPRVSPCGAYVSWMQWNNNNMPWDETEVVVHNAGKGPSLSGDAPRLLLSGVNKDVNFYNPTWAADSKLHVVSDSTNYWNVYEYDVERAAAGDPASAGVNLHPADADIGFPLWQFGDRPFAANRNYQAFNVNGTLYYKRLAGNNVEKVSTEEWNTFSHLTLTEAGIMYCIASGPTRTSTLVKLDLNAPQQSSLSLVRESRPSASLAPFDLSVPQRIEFSTTGGLTIAGNLYKPLNRDYRGTSGTLPPVVIMSHPGPTLPMSGSLDLKKQFFTSRGFAVFDVEYRGSSGRGRKFRNLLNGEWGVVDRDDLVSAAEHLVKQSLVHPRGLCLYGSSASGFSLLAACLARPTLFVGAVSLYGVADLVGLVNDTHKFEVGYNQTLLGKLPEALEEYKKRSPINHKNEFKTPIAFIHGIEDTVVPVQQSIDMYKALKENGVTTALMLFEGEGHGFRGATASRESIEAAYSFLCKVQGITPSVESQLKIDNLPDYPKGTA